MIREDSNATIKDYLELKKELLAIERSLLTQHNTKAHEQCKKQLSALQRQSTLSVLQ